VAVLAQVPTRRAWVDAGSRSSTIAIGLWRGTRGRINQAQVQSDHPLRHSRPEARQGERDRREATPPNFGGLPWPERDLGATYDHEGSPKEFLDAADRICSQANAGSIPFDINVITVAQVNATIGIGEAILAIQELRSRSKEAKKGLAKIKILEERRENL
jgi:hypothetical protein